MKRRLLIVALIIVLTLVASCFVACDEDNNVVTASINFDSNGGGGSVPIQITANIGDEIVLPEYEYTYDGYTFLGWELNGSIYAVGDKYVVSADATFVAKWEKIPEPKAPVFSQESYSYDKSVGGDMELPLNLNGNNLYYVEIDGERALNYTYDDTKGVLILKAKLCVGLNKGDHTVKAITDGGHDQVASCILKIEATIVTSFDEETDKSFNIGTDENVTFNVSFANAEIVSLLLNEVEISEDSYSLQDNVLTINGNVLSRYSGVGKFELNLSNNDRYEFTITNNNIFYSDYDFFTTHSDTASDVGLNPLYQYASNVSIVSAPRVWMVRS